MNTILLAAAEEPSRGWGGPIALGVVVAVYVAGVTLHDWWMRTHPDSSPPPPEAGRGVRVKPQVNAGVDTDDTGRDTNADTGWWGRITNVGGQRVRVIEGSAEPADEEVDVALDDVDEQETIEDVIDRLEYRGVAYSEIVATLMADWRVSEATAKRRIRDARAAREQVS